MATLKFTEQALALGPWSNSKGKMALDCPYKFKLQYIEKKRMDSSAKSGALVIGSAIHKALELIALGTHAEDAMDLALDELAYERDSRPLTVSEQEEYFACTDQIIAFAARLDAFKKKHGVDRRTLYVERRVGMTPNFTPAQFFRDPKLFFRGVWDLGMLSKHGYMIVLDHKRRGRATLANYDTQLKQYAITALANHPKIKGVRAGIHFVESGEIMWAETYTTEYIRDELQDQFISWVNAAAAAAPSDTIGIGNYCQWCDFKDSVCKPERTARRKEAKTLGKEPNITNR